MLIRRVWPSSMPAGIGMVNLLFSTRGLLKSPDASIMSISLLTPFAACSKLIWTEVSWAPPKPNGEKSSNGEKPLPLLFSWPKPLANSPNILRKSSSGLTFALYSHLCVLPNPCWENGLCCCCCWPPLEVEPKVSYSLLFCSSLKTSYASEASYNEIVVNQY